MNAKITTVGSRIKFLQRLQCMDQYNTTLQEKIEALTNSRIICCEGTMALSFEDEAFTIEGEVVTL